MREAGLYIQLSHPHVNQLPAHLPETKDRCVAKTKTCSSPNGAQSKYNCSWLAMKEGARSPPTAEENRTRPGPCEGFNHQMEGPGGVWAQTPQISKTRSFPAHRRHLGRASPQHRRCHPSRGVVTLQESVLITASAVPLAGFIIEVQQDGVSKPCAAGRGRSRAQKCHRLRWESRA